MCSIIDQNFKQIFSHAEPKTVGAVFPKVLSVIRPAPIMLKILPIILSRISQKFCQLFS